MGQKQISIKINSPTNKKINFRNINRLRIIKTTINKFGIKQRISEHVAISTMYYNYLENIKNLEDNKGIIPD